MEGTPCSAAQKLKCFAAIIEENFQETQTGEIDLPDDEPSVVEKMLTFLYDGDYDDERASSSRPKAFYEKWFERALIVNIKVYILAKKNNIEALEKPAKEKYLNVVLDLWYTPSFSTSAILLYDNTLQSDRLLRDIVAETAREHIVNLIRERMLVRIRTKVGHCSDGSPA